jgi:hypothetical protein
VALNRKHAVRFAGRGHQCTTHIPRPMSRNGEPPLPGERPDDRRPPALCVLANVLELSLASPHLLFFTLSIPRPQPSTVVGASLPESCGTFACETVPHCSPFIFRPSVTLPSFVIHPSTIPSTVLSRHGTARLPSSLQQHPMSYAIRYGEKTDPPGSPSLSLAKFKLHSCSKIR